MDSPNTEALYRKLSQRLREFIRKRVHDEAAGKDILQDVFLKIHSRIDSVRDGERIESWIFQITRNAIADHYRNHRETVEPEENIADSPDEETIEAKLAPSVAEMVRSLPEKYRTALQMTDYEGLTQKELADRLGISISGAKSRVQRARAMLKDLLTRCCHFELDRYGTIIDYHPISCSCCQEGSGTAPGDSPS